MKEGAVAQMSFLSTGREKSRSQDLPASPEIGFSSTGRVESKSFPKGASARPEGKPAEPKPN